MMPRIIIYYVRGAYERRPGEKIAKATFVNDGDALIYWNGLNESRKRHLVMETMDGEPIIEIAHGGWNDKYGYYGHACALTEKQPLPPQSGSSRDICITRGWEFETIKEPS